MAKREMMAMLRWQRTAGYREHEPLEVPVNSLTADEEQRLLKCIDGQPFGAVLRNKQVRLFRLMDTITYTGEQVACTRCKVDELDNITVWRI